MLIGLLGSVALYLSYAKYNSLHSLGYYTIPFAPHWLRFDAPPFVGLTTSVSLEAIFLSILMLISQNRASERDKARDKADKARQEALIHEDISLNQQEEANEQNILVLINEVKVAQQEHHEILDRLVQLMEAQQPVKKYRIVGLEKK